MQRPLVLITNDDGVHAPGLRALALALAGIGEVYVVAPDREVSACAQSLTLKNPLRAEQLDERVWSVDGTPADCVNLAMVKLLPRRPQLVVSGINRGANLGEDVFYSGTVGGAREGTFFGVPAIAVSLAVGTGADYAPAAAFTARLAALVIEHGLPERTLLNVNVPAGQPVAAVITVQGQRHHEGTILEGVDPRRRTYYWIEEGSDRWLNDDMSDIHALRRGLISISPLHTDTTHHATLSALRAWEAVLQNGHGAAGSSIAPAAASGNGGDAAAELGNPEGPVVE